MYIYLLWWLFVVFLWFYSLLCVVLFYFKLAISNVCGIFVDVA
ncbi:hypothetical protein PCIT_a4367 [Pseudoalteromonas citrea]|uniref:Uncharacterized protein n=1 Tax=Pseudoalteromonas citrea TaxID=43655 RepID=A0AAD4FQK6_9GAMM|nr:hypothetical protein PCIT_a4367 [Pseudoalteromonas citrea]